MRTLIRIRTILVIVLINLIIIIFAVLAGIMTVQNRIEIYQETDLTLISDIADHFISNELKSLKLEAGSSALVLSQTDRAIWQETLTSLVAQSTDFCAMVVIDSSYDVVATAGVYPARPDVLEDPYIWQAFSGKSCITSTIPITDNTIVFYLSVPMPGSSDNILVLTIPGLHFRHLLSSFSIWETGHIFLSDRDGYAISNPREPWVRRRFNYISIAETDESFTGLAQTVVRMTRGESGMGFYSIYGVPRACSFRPVSGSEEGWSLGVVAPLQESPFIDIDRALIVVGLVSVGLSVIAAVIASYYLKKPFEEIAALKEEAEARSKSKSDFLANMSHEIRTPMNAILGIAEILLNDMPHVEDIRDGLHKIHNSGSLLLNIINDILDLSRIEAGKLDLTHEKYELASLINDTVMLNKMRLDSKPIEFKLEVDENLPSTLIGDELRIKQILNNLLSNAFKYTSDGEVKLSFTAQAGDSGAKAGAEVTLVISVSDTGQGMTEEQLNLLFDEYARFNIVTNRTTEGTGLGMSITQNLLRMMNGEISVTSEPYHGSVFVVRIPQGGTDSKVLGRELADTLANFKSSGMRQFHKVNILYEPMPYGSILIVDDVESNLCVARGLMSPYKLSIETVMNGFQAVSKIREGNVYDIVFMDHMMPRMDGIEATKIIRELGYTQPIVALTANAVVGQIDVFLANGFDDFISKPIDARLLNAVLKKYVRDKQPPEVVEAARRQITTVQEQHPADDAGQHLDVTPRLAEYFVRDALAAAGPLESIVGKNGTYDDEDIRMCIASAHAMKGVLAYIDEEELSATAARLEHAGIERNTDVIFRDAPLLLGELRRLMGELTPPEEETAGASEINYYYLFEKLCVIKDACYQFDKQTAKDMIEDLRHTAWTPQINGHLGAMAEYLLGGDFDEVLSTADALIASGFDAIP